MNHSKYPSSSVHWNGVSTQQYPAVPASSYGQNGYHSSMPVEHNPASSQVPSGYDSPDDYPMQSSYSSAYYSGPHYPSTAQQTNHSYSPVSPTSPLLSYAQAQSHRSGHHIPRPQSTAPHPPYSHSPSSSYSSSYSQSHPSHSVHPSLGRPRSHSQAHERYPPIASGMVSSAHTHYTEIPIPQTIGLTPDYPSSPTKPFSCDLCALSFNRQHDLKRHRETHTGEKPFLCNGGCGKTFTRKDALKRHQLVKNCGKVEESWS
ncbi:unnamed protein product [Cyclocybe aegerita]|uniref:C2H2-type domain-containing protein n=1 Tax=Cyclocybe aegerita TaxID=1973307 RepID=A0A8S0VU62_CYCAE|nr:unnamed protein product [Cyclocybe aegerita]